LDDVGGRLPWSALYSFVINLGTDSALARDLGKATGWETTLKTNAILADIYDQLRIIDIHLVRFISKGRTKPKFKPYPRPGKDDNTKRKIGKGAMPYDELRNWIKERQHG
jgi:hypothetical protein